MGHIRSRIQVNSQFALVLRLLVVLGDPLAHFRRSEAYDRVLIGVVVWLTVKDIDAQQAFFSAGLRCRPTTARRQNAIAPGSACCCGTADLPARAPVVAGRIFAHLRSSDAIEPAAGTAPTCDPLLARQHLSDVVIPLATFPSPHRYLAHSITAFFVVSARRYRMRLFKRSAKHRNSSCNPDASQAQRRSAFGYRRDHNAAYLVPTLLQRNAGLSLRQRLPRITRPSIFDVISLERFHPQPGAKGNSCSKEMDAR